MDIKNIDIRLILIGICILLIISFGVIVYTFNDIDKKGVTCMHNPLNYAEMIWEQEFNDKFYCSCSKDATTDYFQETLNASWNPLLT